MNVRIGLLVTVTVTLAVFAGRGAEGFNSNSTPSSAPAATCPGDFDGDGTVSLADFLAFAGAFGTRSGDANYNALVDLDGSGAVDLSDFLAFAGVFGTTCEAPPPAPVAIPDANLRTLIENRLGKARNAEITAAEIAAMRRFEAGNSGIRDLTGLEFATGLTRLNLHANSITDVSALSGLTNLRILYLGNNSVTDLSGLSGLTELRELYLFYNGITDVSDLSGLTNLTKLQLAGNSIRDVSPLSGMSNLTELHLWRNEIANLSGLSRLTKLTELLLNNNSIREVSALSGLTNLTSLQLNQNKITDVSALSGLNNLTALSLAWNNITNVSALSGLTNLQWLKLDHNQITDVSALSGMNQLHSLFLLNNSVNHISGLSSLTGLTQLDLGFNNVSDVSPLAGMTELGRLRLAHNNISDVSALSGLTNLSSLDLIGNLLNNASVERHIPALEKIGVEVFYHVLTKGDFDIELVFLDTFPEKYKRILRYAAKRWMTVIRGNLPEHQFSQAWSGQCGGRPIEIPHGEKIDDLRIYLTTFAGGSAVGKGGPSMLRQATHLPVMGCMSFDLKRANPYITGLHEIGHVLGFGPIWDDVGLLQEPSGDTHFNGPQAIAAFDDAGGGSYTGKKVPVEKDQVHWRYSVLKGEVMSTYGGGALSAITVQSLAHLGYRVAVTQADAYTLPDAASGDASSKIASAPGVVLWSGADVKPSNPHGLYDFEPHVKGQAREYLSSISGGDHLTMGVENAEMDWARRTTVDFTHDWQTSRVTPLARVESRLKCGAGLTREPIYVVDRQGRIVRTIRH